MRKFPAVLIAFILSLCIVCPKAHAAGEKIRVGVVLPLSGDMAEFGDAARHGLEMATVDLPALTAKYDFIYEDSRYDPVQSAASVRKLITVDRVDLLIIWGEYPALATMEAIEQSRIPCMALALDSDAAKGKEYVVRLLNSADDYVKPMLAFLQGKGHTKIGIIFTEDPYFARLIESIRENLKSPEDLLFVEQVPFGQADFRSIIARMRNRGVDAVAVYLFPGQGSTFFRQARAMQFRAQFFGADTFESRTEIASAEGGMEGAVYSHNTAGEKFHSRYMSVYGSDQQLPYAAISYASGEILAGVSSRLTDSSSPREMMKVLKGLGEMDSDAVGNLQAVSTGNDSYFRFPVAVKEIKGLETVPVY